MEKYYSVEIKVDGVSHYVDECFGLTLDKEQEVAVNEKIKEILTENNIKTYLKKHGCVVEIVYTEPDLKVLSNRLETYKGIVYRRPYKNHEKVEKLMQKLREFQDDLSEIEDDISDLESQKWDMEEKIERIQEEIKELKGE